MPATLQEYIDNLDETDPKEVDRLKAQFLANEEAYRRKHATPYARGGPPVQRTSASSVPLSASSSRRR